ncbi:MAG: three-Cys-motif partner protein TcmP [Deltaproteobacteria bacterium]|jgi:three-Cys-motif partner protein|nr:three-Cys-motif partner protein TcmP [Deltaproteobacteria bacterium]
MDKRPETHFNKPRGEHTEIKHNLFSKTVKISLSIANNMARNNKYASSYTYLDLFAGSGKFKDDSKGSPLIAVEISATHLKDKSNVFKEINLILIEKNQQNADKLKQNVILELEKYNNPKNLKVKIGSASWEEYDVEKILSSSTWGFVFADPFSTELKLDDLKTELENCSKYKDILIFANYNTLARQHARGHDNDIQRVCNFFGISESELQGNDFSEKFIDLLKNQFKSIKDFSIGVAIPIEVKQELRTMDYFYLVLFTSSVMVGNAFLESYENEIEQYRGKETSLPFTNDGDEPLFDLLKQRNELSLKEIWEYYIQNFLSWKKIVHDSNLRVPTLKNITDAINDFRKKDLLKITANEEYIYKKPKDKIGSIKAGSIKNIHDLKAIKIKSSL